MIDKCLCTISETLFRLLPPTWLSALQGSSSVEIQQLEQLTVARAETFIPDVPVSLLLGTILNAVHGMLAADSVKLRT